MLVGVYLDPKWSSTTSKYTEIGNYEAFVVAPLSLIIPQCPSFACLIPDILPQVKCGLEDGPAALKYFSFLSPSVALPSTLTSLPSFSLHLLPVTLLPVLTLLLTLLSILLFVLCRQHQGRKRGQRNAR